MTRIVVTGAAGFIGRHVCEALERIEDLAIFRVDRLTSESDAKEALIGADAIIHLAGVNRPVDADEFDRGNRGYTRWMLDELARAGKSPRIVFSSSSQAALDNPYGMSKRAAEEELRAYAAHSGASVVIFRLTNVFGKWSRPNYNSFVATLCNAVAHNGPFSVDDTEKAVRLLYVNDAVDHLIAAALGEARCGAVEERDCEPIYETTLGKLVDTVQGFRAIRTTLILPDFGDALTAKLYATYLSFLDPDEFAYGLDVKTDPRGSLAEFIRTPQAGQIFVSRTLPGITRGNHYHHTKTEKFLVVEGDAVIRFRHIERGSVIEHRVSGRDYRVLDIPPGYTHSIQNVGETEMVVVFWASEPFDPSRPDTYYLEVLQ